MEKLEVEFLDVPAFIRKGAEITEARFEVMKSMATNTKHLMGIVAFEFLMKADTLNEYIIRSHYKHPEFDLAERLEEVVS